MKFYLFIGFIYFTLRCQQKKAETIDSIQTKTPILVKKAVEIPALEKQLIEQGLVNVQTLDSTIMVELKYSTTDNFVKTDVYGDLTRAYMQKKPAEMLVESNTYLKEMYSHYRLLVYDSARPLSVQSILWNILDSIPPAKREDFVSSPTKGSIHNYGSAVDLTIFDIKSNKPLDMGTKYDFFGDLAYPKFENRMLKEGKLTEKHIQNRLVLRIVMEKSGYMPIESEWWHFNAISRIEAKSKYKIIQ